MKTSRGAIHDRLVATYQSLEASILNRVLMEHGIADLEGRRNIISSFLFEQGVTLDQMWFKEDGRKYFPGVYFSTEPHEQLEDAVVHLPSVEFGMHFHEYAHGAADWALEHESGESQVEVGND